MLQATAGRLDHRHLRAISALLERDPVATVYLRSELRQGLTGGLWFGTGDEEELTAVVLAGPLAVPWIPDASDAPELARAMAVAGLPRMIVSGAASAHALHSALRPFRRPRQIRSPQPLLATRVRPAPSSPGVRRATRDDLEALVVAGAAMHHEEMGVDPMVVDPHAWRARMAALVSRGWSWVWIEDGELIFKTELSAATADCVQLQGVWVPPRHRRRGVGSAGLAAVTAEVLGEADVCSLYVNHYNVAALALYERLGFTAVGEFATIIY